MTFRRLVMLWLAIFCLVSGGLASVVYAGSLVIWFAGRMPSPNHNYLLAGMVMLGGAALLTTIVVSYIYGTRIRARGLPAAPVLGEAAET